MNRLLLATRALLGGTFLLAAAAEAAVPGQDLGPAPADAPMRAAVSLPWTDHPGFAAALRARYTLGDPLFHHWMSRNEVARFGPAAAEIVAARRALSGFGLTVTGSGGAGATLLASGTAAAMRRAFGTPIHAMLRNGARVLVASETPHPQGALAGQVSGVVGLSGETTRSQLLLRPARAAEPVATANAAPANGLPGRFTDHCFGPAAQVRMQGSAGAATWSGLVYQSNANGECAYAPQQIAAHYGLDQVYRLGIQGQGQTIVVVGDAASPRAIEDADTFFAATGVPPFTADTFQMISPLGLPATADDGWASETVVDLELAHAIAPGARIVLAVSPSRQVADLQAINQYVIDAHVGNVIADAFGTGEKQLGPAAVAAWDLLSQEAAAQGISLIAPSGDNGDMSAVEGTRDVMSPADGSYATAVGGTSLDIPSGNGVVETGWGNSASSLGATTGPQIPPQQFGNLNGSGGGISTLVPRPDWQSDRPGAFRQLPDLALIADPYTATFAFWTPSVGFGGYSTAGGTQVATIVFSAMWALMNQGAGYSARTGQFTSGSSFGAAAPQLRQFQSDLLTDALPVDGAHTPQLAGTLTAADGTTSTLDGLASVGLPPGTGSLAVLVDYGQNYYGALSFGTDPGLATSPGFDFVTGHGVPNVPGAVALGLRLFANTN